MLNCWNWHSSKDNALGERLSRIQETRNAVGMGTPSMCNSIAR